MTKSFVKENIVVGDVEKFDVRYRFRHVHPTDTRNAYLGLITDISLSVQARLNFPDFGLYSGLLHTVRAMAIKSWLSPSTSVFVNGVGIYINDLGGTITITDK